MITADYMGRGVENGRKDGNIVYERSLIGNCKDKLGKHEKLLEEYDYRNSQRPIK